MDGDALLVGLLIGLIAGLLLGSVVRWALAIREWRQASREAGLTDEVLRRMTDENHESSDRAQR
jgi:hypothetical protein